LKKFKLAAVAMVTKVQKMLNSLRRVDPFETWHKNRSPPFQNGCQYQIKINC
jgi:hypothetical protein